MFNPYGFGFYLKSGVMENGVICKTEEGSPQGGPLSPLLANIYLNEFDWEMYRRGGKAGSVRRLHCGVFLITRFIIAGTCVQSLKGV